MKDRRILTNWYKEIARHCLQDRKTEKQKDLSLIEGQKEKQKWRK